MAKFGTRLEQKYRSASGRLWEWNPIQVATVDEAERQAGFTPRLPTRQALSADAHLSVLEPMLFGARINLANLNRALRNVGIARRLPEHWDDGELRLQVGAIVTAEWDELQLMQCLPPVLETPSGFDLGAFSTAVFLAAGLEEREAASLGRRMAVAPALMFGVGGEEAADMRSIKLRSGAATMIQDFDEEGLIERVAIVWSAPDRLYLLSGAVTPNRAIELANAVP